MRLIDADKLMENKFKNDISYNAFCNLVKRQPSIDAVQVIRCKYYKENTLVCSRYGLEDDDYCSWAERKES